MNDPLGSRLLRLWPFLVLGILAVTFVVMLSFSRKAPVIASLDPPMAAPGQQVVIVGDYFGRTEREGTLSLAGEIPPPSLIQSWSDQKIVFTVPEDASSGLVTVSNSQGTSTGVLFTNTESIPTVLQAASAPGDPLLVAVVPPVALAGQTVTLMGRGFGPGDRRSSVRLVTGAGGPVFNLEPSDCQVWTDRSICFLWPAGAGPSSSVQVVTALGSTPVFPIEGSSPLAFERPRSISVVISITASTDSPSLVLWGPVPQTLSGTSWVLDSAQPQPLAGSQPLAFVWNLGSSSDRRAVYQLTLTTWARRWDGFPSGPQGLGAEVPQGDDRPAAWWKPSQSALKALVAKWGLETSDPWLRAQRIHNGLVAAFRFVDEPSRPGGLSRTPAQILASGSLPLWDASSLGVALARQAGIPGRLVSGLWLDDHDRPQPRVWSELWFAGAGWVPWDVALGPPGALDNRHFPFETGVTSPVRLLAKAQILGDPAPVGQGEPAGEAVSGGRESAVRWDIQRTEK